MKDGTLTPFSKRYVQEICLQVISGLQYLHRTKVVHSTLSPDVIWLTDDFGYQSHYHRGRDGFVEMKTLRTTKLQIGYYGQMSDKCPGAIVVEGVDQYRAPEVLMGRRPLPQNDHFALGCILFELVARRPLFVECHAEGINYVREKLLMMTCALGPIDEMMADQLSSRATTIGISNLTSDLIHISKT
ncbi:CMGC/CLK protein kinase [Coprinopsis cinerea AmutBmut pab1-1]|nr:CMGC/CLK protein kinase [Coprinopsis cinerea AmutBmut pab1-1]